MSTGSKGVRCSRELEVELTRLQWLLLRCYHHSGNKASWCSLHLLVLQDDVLQTGHVVDNFLEEADLIQLLGIWHQLPESAEAGTDPVATPLLRGHVTGDPRLASGRRALGRGPGSRGRRLRASRLRGARPRLGRADTLLLVVVARATTDSRGERIGAEGSLASVGQLCDFHALQSLGPLPARWGLFSFSAALAIFKFPTCHSSCSHQALPATTAGSVQSVSAALQWATPSDRAPDCLSLAILLTSAYLLHGSLARRQRGAWPAPHTTVGDGPIRFHGRYGRPSSYTALGRSLSSILVQRPGTACACEAHCVWG
eukprot:scaffold2995_cov430-Prasinococcus_capsulatus_cf.AAC.4